jgi:1,4-dihydroxy-6-naphthoate synthase
MFWALKNGLVATAGLTFTFTALDTAALNQAAERGTHDVVAISAACYPRIETNYAILPHGASVGRGFGPALVALDSHHVSALRSATIGIPGATTTAALVARRLLPEARWVEIPISPYGEIFRALKCGEIQAAVLIHEGQLEFEAHGLKLVADLGKVWEQEFSLPLPLGLNVIRRALDPTLLSQISGSIKSSIEYGLSHLEELLPELCRLNRDRGTDTTSPEAVRRYLSRYVNEDTLELKQDALEALEILFNKPAQLA